MNVSMFLKSSALLSAACLAFGLAACGDDSASSSSDNGSGTSSVASSSASTGGEDGDDTGDTQTSSSSIESGPVADQSSSSKKQQTTETTSSEEALNEAKKDVTGTCAPESDINKGELATWAFYRNGESNVFQEILAPFVWKFSGASQEAVQGNGLKEVNVRYEKAGSYSASLTVDGNTIECEELLVQGIPITVESCEPDKSTVNVGETITWTVKATSEAKITGYSWSSTNARVSGTGVEGSMVAPKLHKETVTATVTISNEDNSVAKYNCQGVTVIDPDAVDLVLPVFTGDINSLAATEENTVPDGVPTIVQIPTTVSSPCSWACRPSINVNSEMMKFTVNDQKMDPYYISNCSPGAKYTILATPSMVCGVKNGN